MNLNELVRTLEGVDEQMPVKVIVDGYVHNLTESMALDGNEMVLRIVENDEEPAQVESMLMMVSGLPHETVWFDCDGERSKLDAAEVIDLVEGERVLTLVAIPEDQL